MIDLHAHILPGLDDGAQDIDDSLEMAEMAAESGVHILAATPHSNQRGRFENYNSPELNDIYQDFCRVLQQEKIPLKIVPGMEIMASEDMTDRIKNGRLTGLNRTRYHLIEFPFDAEPDWIGERLEDVWETGNIPLIAHPERYFCVQEYPVLVYEWLQMGCLTQINKGSLFGKFGRHARNLTEIMLENRLVTCVASDAHSPYMRTTYMRDAREYLEDRVGEEQAYRLLTGNPAKIIGGERIRVHGRPPVRKKWFFG